MRRAGKKHRDNACLSHPFKLGNGRLYKVVGRNSSNLVSDFCASTVGELVRMNLRLETQPHASPQNQISLLGCKHARLTEHVTENCSTHPPCHRQKIT